jgi:hypothetical protein
MVSVHLMAMRCAHHLANAEDIAGHDSAARALGRLARTFPAQIEALNRHRSHGEPAITVQNVSVGDGGKAIVGNVTQHASVIVSDNNPASAARKAPKGSGSRRAHATADAERKGQASVITSAIRRVSCELPPQFGQSLQARPSALSWRLIEYFRQSRLTGLQREPWEGREVDHHEDGQGNSAAGSHRRAGGDEYG